MQVIWIFASADQGMRAIRRYLGRRGVGYALAFTLIVTLVGAAGILHFEKNSQAPETMQTYERALWWRAMQMTNIGSAYAIKTAGGRVRQLLGPIIAYPLRARIRRLSQTPRPGSCQVLRIHSVWHHNPE